MFIYIIRKKKKCLNIDKKDPWKAISTEEVSHLTFFKFKFTHISAKFPQRKHLQATEYVQTRQDDEHSNNITVLLMLKSFDLIFSTIDKCNRNTSSSCVYMKQARAWCDTRDVKDAQASENWMSGMLFMNVSDQNQVFQRAV